MGFLCGTKHRSCTVSYSSQKGTVEHKLGQTHFESNGRASPKQTHCTDTGQQGNHKHAMLGRLWTHADI